MNVKNRTIFCNDNLYILRGLDTESVDLIYLDPPFNSNRTYSAPIGSEAAGAAFKDTWTLSDVDNAWHGEISERQPALYQAIHASELTHGKGMKSYLIMLAVRLLEMKRVLKATGSIYLHCDPTASHYLKVVMDSVFGKDMFRNEIVWYYGGPSATKTTFPRKHDLIFFYSKTDSYLFNQQTGDLPPYLYKRARKDTDGKLWVDQNLGKLTNETIRKMEQEGKVFKTKTGKLRRKQYLNEMKGSQINDVWDTPIINSQSKERTGYPTQKPLSLLQRIIQASSNENDIVLDPFCGCATTCVAAEQLGRQWIGIDISPKAIQLVRTRLEKEVGFFGKVIARDDIPQRSERLPNYRTHKHTLYGKQEGLCNGCKTQFPFRNMTVDHIVPQSQGGTDHEDNLQLLCGACNSTKGTGTQAELIAKLTEQDIL